MNPFLYYVETFLKPFDGNNVFSVWVIDDRTLIETGVW